MTVDDATPAPPSPPEFAQIQIKLDDLVVAICNLIDREQFAWLSSRHRILPALLKSVVRMAAVEFRAIVQLVHDKRDGQPPPGDFATVIPPLARTYVDALYTVMFVCDDPAVRGRFYVASGLAFASAYHSDLTTRYGTDPQHAQWFANHKAWIDSHEASDKPTPQELQKPKSLYWPNPGSMRRQMVSTDAKSFMQFVDLWFYRQLSQDAHFAYMGLARNASFVLAEQPPATIKKYREIMFSTALALFVALLSEVIAQAKLPGEARRIEEIWRYLLPIEAVADLWRERYERALAAVT